MKSTGSAQPDPAPEAEGLHGRLARRLRPVLQGAFVAAGLLGLVGCGSVDSEADTSRLRITNAGTEAIVNLTVRFPDDRIGFGDIPAGATTGYRDVPNGVYSYAAFSLEIDGALVSQPVIDFVGEVPMEGNAFTYTLVVHPRGAPFEIVELVSVSIDE